MARYIDADLILEQLSNKNSYSVNTATTEDILKAHIYAEIICLIEHTPTADVVEVVRCEDCIFKSDEDIRGYFICKKTDGYFADDDFCSYGQQKEEK